MYSVFSSNCEPLHLKELHKWFVAEWGEMNQFVDSNINFVIPAPLVALDGARLIGGLAFTGHPIPDDKNIGLWINALIVAPEYRKKGIGSQLISAAVVEAKRNNVKKLFVYTHIPALYKSLGWIELNNDGKNSTLKSVR